MAYATVQDLLERYPRRDLAHLTDPQGQVVDEARLEAALADASAEMDRYGLQTVQALPEAERKRICCDIAIYRLMVLRPLDDIQDARRRYEDAIGVLQQRTATEGVVDYFAGPRRLSPEQLEDYIP